MRFSEEDQERHQELRLNEVRLNKLLAKFIRDSTKPSSATFKKYSELCYLQKPNHLIMKPVFAVMMIKQTFPPVPKAMDWSSYPEQQKFW